MLNLFRFVSCVFRWFVCGNVLLNIVISFVSVLCVFYVLIRLCIDVSVGLFGVSVIGYIGWCVMVIIEWEVIFLVGSFVLFWFILLVDDGGDGCIRECWNC